MLTLHDIVMGIGLPVVVGIVMMLAIVWSQRSATRRRVYLAWTLAVAGAYVAGHLAINGPPRWQGTIEANDWPLMAIVPGCVVIGMLDAANKLPAAILWLLRCLAAIGLPLLLLWPLLDQIGEPWSVFQSLNHAITWLVGLSAAILLVWIGLARLERANPGRTLAPALAAVAGATGLVIMMSDSQTLGQLALAGAAGMLGASVIAIWLPRRLATAGCSAIIWPLTAGFLIIGYFYAEQDTTHAKWILLAVAPLLAWVGQVKAVRRLPVVWRVATSLVAVGIPTAAALLLAGLKFYREMTASGHF